jgi:hypothetical protein
MLLQNEIITTSVVHINGHGHNKNQKRKGAHVWSSTSYCFLDIEKWKLPSQSGDERREKNYALQLLFCFSFSRRLRR